MFLHYETIYENEKKIVVVDIQRGTDRPYYIAKKGMRPEGVYVRQGYSSVPATDAAIRLMIKETDGDHFEAMRSLNQNLTFYATTEEFQLRNVEFGPQQMRSLKLIDSDGLYTNLALLLSDQCVHSIKDLANIFYRLQLIEAYGTGISKIMKAYEGTNTRPRIETTKNTFKIILPNVNTNSGSTITSIPAKEEAPVFILNDNPALSSQEKRILEYARNYNQITKNNAASLLEVSASTATRLINGLLKQNLLVRHGKARNT